MNEKFHKFGIFELRSHRLRTQLFVIVVVEITENFISTHNGNSFGPHKFAQIAQKSKCLNAFAIFLLQIKQVISL